MFKAQAGMVRSVVRFSAGLMGVVWLVGCDTEAPPAEVPEVPPVAEIAVGGGEVSLQSAMPLEDDDIGKIVVMAGTVVGTPRADGFFLKAPTGEAIFIQHTGTVATGESLRVAGPLRTAPVAVVDQWKTESLSGDVEVQRTVLEGWYVAATRVSKS